MMSNAIASRGTERIAPWPGIARSSSCASGAKTKRSPCTGDAPSIIYVNGSLTIRGLAIRNQWPGCAECRQYTGSMSFVGWYWPGWLCRACQHRLDPGYGHELNTRVASVFARRAIRRGAQSRRGDIMTQDKEKPKRAPLRLLPIAQRCAILVDIAPKASYDTCYKLLGVARSTWDQVHALYVIPGFELFNRVAAGDIKLPDAIAQVKPPKELTDALDALREQHGQIHFARALEAADAADAADDAAEAADTAEADADEQADG